VIKNILKSQNEQRMIEQFSRLDVLYIQTEYPLDFENIIDKFDAEASIRVWRLTLK